MKDAAQNAPNRSGSESAKEEPPIGSSMLIRAWCFILQQSGEIAKSLGTQASCLREAELVNPVAGKMPAFPEGYSLPLRNALGYNRFTSFPLPFFNLL